MIKELYCGITVSEVNLGDQSVSFLVEQCCCTLPMMYMGFTLWIWSSSKQHTIPFRRPSQLNTMGSVYHSSWCFCPNVCWLSLSPSHACIQSISLCHISQKSWAEFWPKMSDNNRDREKLQGLSYQLTSYTLVSAILVVFQTSFSFCFESKFTCSHFGQQFQILYVRQW